MCVTYSWALFRLGHMTPQQGSAITSSCSCLIYSKENELNVTSYCMLNLLQWPPPCTLWEPSIFVLFCLAVCCRVIMVKKEMKVKAGAERAESGLTKIKKWGFGEGKVENWEWAEQLREKIDFEYDRVSDSSELHQESKDKQKILQKLARESETFSWELFSRQTHPASLPALPQPFNWFNSPKWSLSVSQGSFFLSCHIWDASLDLLRSKSV